MLSLPRSKLNKTNGRFTHSVLVDEDYSMMWGHVDESLKQKIIRHEYTDFARLIPHDRTVAEEDQRMEMINHNGQTFWQPVRDRELTSISSFYCWEQAFRLFSQIYTEHYPHKAAELVQYNYTIHSASLLFVWGNMYAYDKDFRSHISHHQNVLGK